MSFFSNVTEKDLDNLRKLADQQKEQRALKIKNRILKQTHVIKLAESSSPVTKRLDKLKESTEKLGDVIKESQPKTPQLAFENTPQRIENNEGVIYDLELENTSNKMKDNTGFFKTYHDPQRRWTINNHRNKMLRGTKVEINENLNNISPGIRNVLVDQSYDTAKSMTDKDKLFFRDILQKTGYYNRIPTKGRWMSRDRYIKYDLDNHVSRILNLDTKLKGRGIEKITIPSNIIDIYTRLEILLGLKLSGHADTLTEASNLIDELYKQGEIKTNNKIGMLSTNFHK